MSRGRSILVSVEVLTRTFPAEERFGIVTQMRRAAVSVPTNIAEGSKRQGKGDFAHFLNIAEGSLAETQYLVMLAADLGYLSDATKTPLLAEIDEISAMLYTFRSKVEQGER